MSRRRQVKGVLGNYLSSLTSRYSDHGGYWMLGFLAADPEPVVVPLLGPLPAGGSPAVIAFAERARSLFREQVQKAGLPLSAVAEASLVVSKSPLVGSVWLNGRQRPARELAFVVRAETDLGRAYERERAVQAAPHDPAIETRSTRAGATVWPLATSNRSWP